MKLAIVGAGALGSLYGFLLARSPNADVTLIDKNPQIVQSIRKRGLLATLDGEVARVGVDAYSIEEARCCHDVVLVMVKSYNTGEAAPIVSKLIGETGIAVTLQNGLGNREVLARHVGDDRVVQGVSTWGATLKEPGHVIIAGKGETILGKPPGSSFSGVFDRFVSLLRDAGLAPRVVDDIDTHVWRKVIVNTVVNTLTCLLRVRNGFLLESSNAQKIAKRVFEEAYLTAVLEGARLEGADEEWKRLLSVVESTRNNLSSMLQDVLSCRKTEAESIIGEVVSRGRMRGLEMKYSGIMFVLVKALEERSPGHCL